MMATFIFCFFFGRCLRPGFLLYLLLAAPQKDAAAIPNAGMPLFFRQFLFTTDFYT